MEKKISKMKKEIRLKVLQKYIHNRRISRAIKHLS